MQDLILALRNIGRNRRRSAVTMLAVALSCGGLTLFGGYVSWTFRAVEEQTIGTSGHLQIYQRGYFDEGSGDPASYALSNYEEIRTMLTSDPIIGPRVELVTPQILFTGLVTAPRTRASSTFVGLGVQPSEEKRLNGWNPYGLFRIDLLEINAPLFSGPAELDDADAEGGSIGIGLGKVLRLDKPLPPNPVAAASPSAPARDDDADIAFLTAQSGSSLSGASGHLTVDLLCSPPDGGAPNVTSITVRRVVPRATKEMDDHLIKMHIRHASELMHAGSLIVDDIEDSSQLRRGARCIHLRHGLNVAINAANTLYFLPFLHLLDHPTVGDPKRHRICEILLRNCVRAHFGQGHDIFWSNHLDPHSLALWLEDKLPEKILQMYHYKTGAAVEGLAEIACIIAEADAAVTEACKDFGRSFSVAFQIMDDIHNFSDSAEWTKRCAEDLAEGKLTYVMVNALRMLEERDRERLAQIVCSKTLRQEADGQGEACELMRRSGALESCRSEAQMLAQRSWEKFAKALPNSWPRMILRMMTLRLLRQDFGCGSP